MEKPILAPGEQLTAGEQIRSSNQRYIVRYQEDGNAVLYDTSVNPYSAKWDSGTLGVPPGKFRMQEDGNLVIYAADGQSFVLYSHDGASLKAVWDAWSDNARRAAHTGGGHRENGPQCGWETSYIYNVNTDSWDVVTQWVCH
jgi:hypothetical protein